MNPHQARAVGAAFQVQTSRDGVTWDARQPAPTGNRGRLWPGGNYWFPDYDSAWSAVARQGEEFKSLAVRIAVKDRHGNDMGAVE